MQMKIMDLLERIQKFELDPTSVHKLPDNNYYLDNDYILCTARKYGVSRYPYESDGLVLWASDNGHITANESELTVFRPSYTDEVPCMGFFLGIKQADGTYLPISATEANGQFSEPASLKRYTVFAPAAAYYITATDSFVFCVRVFLDDDKKVHFTLHAWNQGKKTESVYLASYFEALLRYEESEGYWVRKARTAVKLDNGNIVMKTNHFLTNCLSVNYDIAPAAKKIETTVSSIDFTGKRGRSFANGLALKIGSFAGQGKVDWKTEYASLPIAGNITHFDLAVGESCQLDVSFLQSYDYDEAVATATTICSYPDLSQQVAEKESRLTAALQPLSIQFKDWTAGKLDTEVLNCFLKTVQRQVEICSFGKSYAGPRLGVRDVFQQLEAALLWAPNAVRQRILLMFGYLDPSGRAPRQITITPNEKLMPNLDIRPFIDQGFWMIDTVYSYLCHTGDYSILEEECGYCNLPNKPKVHMCRV